MTCVPWVVLAVGVLYVCVLCVFCITADDYVSGCCTPLTLTNLAGSKPILPGYCRRTV